MWITLISISVKLYRLPRRDVPLYCGEYGVIDLADPAETLKWYRIIHEAFEKHKIGRAAWNYRGKDFGFVDEHLKPVIDEIVDLL